MVRGNDRKPMNAQAKLDQAIRRSRSLVCVGLDTDPARLPACLRKHKDPVTAFNRSIIAATADLVCAYKLNLAFYEAYGGRGLSSLERTLAFIPSRVLVILDGKRGDIGNTSSLYARSLFDHYRADAVTVHPYMGYDSLAPFFEYRDKLTFVLCLTSNPGARQFQWQPARRPLYLAVAKKAHQWQARTGNCGLVMGGTYPAALKRVRRLCPGQTFLIPGIGAQAGDVKKVLSNGLAARGVAGLVINSSRGIIYADSSKRFDLAAREQARQLREEINNYLIFKQKA